MSRETRSKAIEALKVSIDARLDGRTEDLDASVDRFRAVVAKEAEPRTLDALARAVTNLSERIESYGDRFVGPHLRGLVLSYVASVEERLLDILEGPLEVTAADKKAEAAAAQELTRARQEISDLTAELDDAQRQLEDAVRLADLDRIVVLRRSAEVEIPTRLDAARLRLADAEIQEAALPVGPADEAKRSTAEEAEKIADKVRVAEAALARAQKELEEARARAAHFRARAERASEALASLRKRRAAMASEHEEARQVRVRRFAGLPEPTGPERSAPPDHSVIRADRVGVTVVGDLGRSVPVA
ncbi:MAG TPA: hypothetical protein VFH50_02315 [Acidimicrobiales bacterium]|nr:hypothetical protein [Acidimicrobiales bacterium]